MEFTGERFVPDKAADRDLAIEHTQRYYSLEHIVEGKKVLDAACGEGYGASFLSRTAEQVFGIDISDETIEHARQTYQRDNLIFLKSSVDSVPLNDSSIDVVVSYETIEHLDELTQHKFLKEITRILRPNGLLVISTPNKKEYTDRPRQKNSYHIKEFYKEEFRNFLGQYFGFVKFAFQSFEVVSRLSHQEATELTILGLQVGKKLTEGKYIVAICSAVPSNVSLDSAVINPERYDTIMERIISLQDEVGEKNNHIASLIEQSNEKDALIEARGQRIEELSSWGQSLDLELSITRAQLSEEELRIQDLSEKNRRIEEALEVRLEQSNEKDALIEARGQRIEELSGWGQSLDLELSRTRAQLSEEVLRIQDLLEKNRRLEEALEVCKLAISEKDSPLKESKTRVDALKEQKTFLDDSDANTTLLQELNKREETINNQRGHIEQLLAQERILKNIYDSDGWKLLTRYYRLKDRAFPETSRRKLVAKIIFRTLKHPGLIRQHVNITNFKKFYRYMKTEDQGTLRNRIDSYFQKYSEQKNLDFKVFAQPDSWDKITFPASDFPLVTIVIPVFNQWDYTYSCLRAILENTSGVDYEVIIADDVSSDETRNVATYVQNIRVMRQEENLGFLRNCNAAAKAAESKYIVFLNNDTNVQAGWLEALVELAEGDPSIGLVGSKLIYEDGTLQESGGIIWKDGTGWNYGRYDDPEKPEYNYVKEVDYISGAALMIKTDLWQEIGGFDELYVPAYFEDADLAFEVRARGYKTMLQPRSRVVHFEGKSHGTDTGSGTKKYQIENREKFVDKWNKILEKEHYANGENVFCARDRSWGRRTILVIDHYVPHFDQDAGSRTTFQYLKLFVTMGFNVKFLGDNFYRHEPYTGVLQQLGIEVFYGLWFRDNYKKWIRDHAENLDFIYLNRPHIAENYIDFIKRETKAKVIYYGHDLHFLRERREYEINPTPGLLHSSEEWKSKELSLITKSDASYFPSQVEVDEIKKALPDARVKAIPAYMFSDSSDHTGNDFSQRKDIVFVGGFTHRPNVDGIVWFLDRVFPKVLAGLPELKLYIVGSNPPDAIKGYSSENVIITGYISDQALTDLYRNSRMVVVPLRYGAGIKGKVVEALYYEMPVITTTSGAEGLPDIGNYLMIVDEPDEFARSILRLYPDEEFLRRLASKGKEYILLHFSRDACLEAIKDDFC